MKKRIVIKRYSDDKIIKSIDVSEKSDRQIEKIDNGMNINLNHELYYTDVLHGNES